MLKIQNCVALLTNLLERDTCTVVYNYDSSGMHSRLYHGCEVGMCKWEELAMRDIFSMSQRSESSRGEGLGTCRSEQMASGLSDSAESSGVRKRRRGEKGADEEEDSSQELSEAATSSRGDGKRGEEKRMEPGSYWLTRMIFIRALGFIYCKYFTQCH